MPPLQLFADRASASRFATQLLQLPQPTAGIPACRLNAHTATVSEEYADRAIVDATPYPSTFVESDMQPIPSVRDGTVSEFDFNDGLGLIDADNGEIVFFNAANLNTRQASMLAIGSRVQFGSPEDTFGPHADFVRLSA
jgi:cold shock CspA family protein